MFKRRLDDYIQKFYKDSKNSLLLTGARQTGKTYAVRKFGLRFKVY